MGFFESAAVSASGLTVHRQIMDVITENLANVNTIQSSNGQPYQRKIPIVASRQQSAFGDMLAKSMYSEAYMSRVDIDPSPPLLDYDPSHPLADEKGYVRKPNVNVSLEMITMMNATRAYEANVQVFNASRSMAARALQIGA